MKRQSCLLFMRSETCCSNLVAPRIKSLVDDKLTSSLSSSKRVKKGFLDQRRDSALELIKEVGCQILLAFLS